MGSLGGDFLFNNIPPAETTDICSNALLKTPERVGFSNIEFQLLSFVLKESHFIFNGKLYRHIDRVAITSPFHPDLTNTSLVYFGRN